MARFDVTRLRQPIEHAVAVLAAYSWDSDEELVELTRADAVHLLSAYADLPMLRRTLNVV